MTPILREVQLQLHFRLLKRLFISHHIYPRNGVFLQHYFVLNVSFHYKTYLILNSLPSFGVKNYSNISSHLLVSDMESEVETRWGRGGRTFGSDIIFEWPLFDISSSILNSLVENFHRVTFYVGKKVRHLGTISSLITNVFLTDKMSASISCVK